MYSSALNRLDTLLKEQLKSRTRLFLTTQQDYATRRRGFIVEDEHKLHIHEMLNATEDLPITNAI